MKRSTIVERFFLSVWFSERLGRALLSVGCGKLGGCRVLSCKVGRPLRKFDGFLLKAYKNNVKCWQKTPNPT